MKLCQSSKRGAFSAALIGLGLGLTLIAGCSDSRTSTVGASLQRCVTGWCEGNYPIIPDPPVKEPIAPVLGTAGVGGKPGDWYAFKPGQNYTIAWQGGGGNKAEVMLQRLGKGQQWQKVWTKTSPNTGSLPATFPFESGVYSLVIMTYNDHPACYQFGTHGSCYYSSCRGAPAAWTPLKNISHPGGSGYLAATNAQALAECRADVKKMGGNTSSCRLLSPTLCKNGNGGVAGTFAFWIESFTPGGQSIYEQIENSASNRIASGPPQSSTQSNSQAAPKTNVVAIGAPSDAKDDKSVTHIANSGVAGGR